MSDEPIGSLLDASQDPCRENAVRAAVAEGDVPALLRVLGDGPRAARVNAATALGRIGDRSAVPALLEASEDPDEWVAEHAIHALGALGDRRAVPTLIRRLSDPSEAIREAAAGALGDLRDARAVPSLITASSDESYEVADDAIWALRQIGGAAVDCLLRQLDSGEPAQRVRALELLDELGASSAEAAVLHRLDDASAAVRRAAVEALGGVGTRRSVSDLMRLVGRDDEPTRGVAAWSLARLGASEARPLLEARRSAENDVAVLADLDQALQELRRIQDSASSEDAT
jgi:HEAT repeat protein